MRARKFTVAPPFHSLDPGLANAELLLDTSCPDLLSVLHHQRILRPGGRYALIARTLSGFAQAAAVGGLITLISNKRMGVFRWRPNERADLDVLADLLEQGLVSPRIDRRFWRTPPKRSATYRLDTPGER